MKFRVTMKDPDCLHDTVREAVELELDALKLPADERGHILDLRCEKTREKCAKWFEYGEYLTVEIDTEADTCVVVPRK